MFEAEGVASEGFDDWEAFYIETVGINMNQADIVDWYAACWLKAV